MLRRCSHLRAFTVVLGLIFATGWTDDVCDQEGLALFFQDRPSDGGYTLTNELFANDDGRVDISDAITLFMYLFLGGSEPACLDAADTEDDGALNLTDGLKILLDFFGPGTSITEPGPFRCGFDPTEDVLPCTSHASCL